MPDRILFHSNSQPASSSHQVLAAQCRCWPQHGECASSIVAVTLCVHTCSPLTFDFVTIQDTTTVALSPDESKEVEGVVGALKDVSTGPLRSHQFSDSQLQAVLKIALQWPGNIRYPGEFNRRPQLITFSLSHPCVPSFGWKHRT